MGSSLFGDYAAWVFFCNEPTIGVYNISTKTLKVDFQKGLTLAVPGKYSMLVHDIARVDGVGIGEDMFLMEYETWRQIYITPRRISGGGMIDGKYVILKHCREGSCYLFLWDLEKAGFTDAEGRMLP
jgi:hypothetical protein